MNDETREYKNNLQKKRTYFFIKRVFDIVLSFFAMFFFSPLILAIAFFIKLEDRGPIFYKHRRVGQYGQPLDVFKFRSMTTFYKTFDEFYDSLSNEQKKEWDENYKLENDPRLTKIGEILRKTSLDELPQLFNIFLGNMSFVGPRPVVADELEKFGEQQEKLLLVKPGLTGYWAVNGRSSTTYEKRVQLELFYVDHCSLWLDIKIFLRTIFAVIKRDGAL